MEYPPGAKNICGISVGSKDPGGISVELSGVISVEYNIFALSPVSPGDILALLGLGGLWGLRGFKKGVEAPPLQ